MYLYVRMHVRCMMPELARLLVRSESSRDVLDCRLLHTSKFLSAGKPLAVRILSKTGGPGECAPNRGSHGQTVRVDRSGKHNTHDSVCLVLVAFAARIICCLYL